MAKAKKKTAVKKEQTAPAGSAKSDALDRAIAQIEKQYGTGSIMKMDESLHPKINGIATGALSLDIALGGAGIPRGRVVEFYGPESSGKTTLTLQVVAECQKMGGTAAFIDAEHALDPAYAKKLGVNIDDLLVSQPDSGEQALEICDMLVRSSAVDVVVVDTAHGHSRRVLDTVRADHMSTYGYERATTPNLDELARRGVVFDWHFATAPWT